MSFFDSFAQQISDIILGFAIGLVFWPISVILWIILKLYRGLIGLILNALYGDKIFLAHGSDAIFSFNGNSDYPGPYMNSILVMNGKPSLQNIRETYLNLLSHPSGNYEKFSWNFVQKFGLYVWEKTYGEFNIENHIRCIEGLNPEEIFDNDKINKLMSKFSLCKLPSDRPQWEILLLPNQFRSRENFRNPISQNYILILRFHHCYSDGISFISSLIQMADSPITLPVDPCKPLPISQWFLYLYYLKTLWFGPLNFLRNFSTMMKMKKSSEFWYKSQNTDLPTLYSRSEAFDLSILKKIKEDSGASVTAILFAAISASLKKAHEKLWPGVEVPEELNAASITAMLPYPDKSMQNRFTIVPFTAPLGKARVVHNNLTSVKDLIAESHKSAKKINTGSDPLFNYHLKGVLGGLPRFMQHPIFRISGTPVILSNIPGITNQFNLFGGFVQESGAWVPLVNMGLAISTHSYLGKLRFCISADPKVFKSSAELQAFTDDILKHVYLFSKMFSYANTTMMSNTISTTKTNTQNAQRKFDDNDLNGNYLKT